MTQMTDEEQDAIIATIPVLNDPLGRELEYAEIGGGHGSFIGQHHERSSRYDGRARLACGAFGTKPRISAAMARSKGADPDRSEKTSSELIRDESDGGVDFVAITTENDTHRPLAEEAMDAGHDVIIDKPLTVTTEDSQALVSKVEETKSVLGVTFHNTGYPMVILMMHMVISGEIGMISLARALYYQGWLRTKLEDENQKQAAWRTNAEKGGKPGAFGDIGTHAYNLFRFVTGLTVETVEGNFRSFAEERSAFDWGTATCEISSGGILQVEASQVSHGKKNALSLHLDGTTGGLDWFQEKPNELHLRRNGSPLKTYVCDENDEDLGKRYPAFAEAKRHAAAHPEGWYGAMANVWGAFMDDVIIKKTNEDAEYGVDYAGRDTKYPNVYDGLEATYFMNLAVESFENGKKPLPFNEAMIARPSK